MKAFVERQRFRTWDAKRDIDAGRQWRIIVRYGVGPMLRSWYIYTPLVMWAMALIAVLGVSTSLWVSSEPSSVNGMALGAIAMSFLAVGGLFTLLVGSQVFSEDLRFNSPLFYFSKPLRTPQYAWGKIAHIAAFVVTATLVPVVLWLLLGLLVGMPLRSMPDFEAWYGGGRPGMVERFEHEWRVNSIDGLGQWAYAVAVVVPGLLAASTFFVSLAAVIGVHTRRAWHTAMGIVAVIGGWGMLGVIAGDLHRTALADAYGPFGWIHAVVMMPLELAFSTSANPLMGEPSRHYEHAGGAIAVGYVMLLGLSALCIHLTLRRLRRLEALL